MSGAELKESVAEVVIAKARELVEPVADKYQPAEFVYWVASGKKGNVSITDSHDEYCEKCIEYAIAKERDKFISERNAIMGRIYEILTTGTIVDVHFKEDKEGNVIGNHLKYYRPPKHVTREDAVKDLKTRLKREFSLKTVFESDYDRCSNINRERFEHCENCGITFEYNIALEHSDELDYYEELSTEELKEHIKEPQGAYEFLQILDYWDRDFTLRIGAIAGKLL